MKKILLVNANYYEKIAEKIVISTEKILKKEKFSLNLVQVPGILEIPFTIRKNIKKFDAFIALGCVIKGNTPHFHFICNATFNSILELSISYNKPITNGIITAFNLKQAKERCGLIRSNKPNKGEEAARALISILKNGTKKI